jgi:hypothetical protein
MEKAVARFVHFRALFHPRVEDGNGRLDIFGQFSSKFSIFVHSLFVGCIAEIRLGSQKG